MLYHYHFQKHHIVMTDIIVKDLPDFGLSPVPVATPGRTPRPLNPGNIPIQFKNKKYEIFYFV